MPQIPRLMMRIAHLQKKKKSALLNAPKALKRALWLQGVEEVASLSWILLSLAPLPLPRVQWRVTRRCAWQLETHLGYTKPERSTQCIETLFKPSPFLSPRKCHDFWVVNQKSISTQRTQVTMLHLDKFSLHLKKIKIWYCLMLQH